MTQEVKYSGSLQPALKYVYDIENKNLFSNKYQSFCGPMVRIPPFQGGGRCSVSTFKTLHSDQRINIYPKF